MSNYDTSINDDDSISDNIYIAKINHKKYMIYSIILLVLILFYTVGLIIGTKYQRIEYNNSIGIMPLSSWYIWNNIISILILFLLAFIIGIIINGTITNEQIQRFAPIIWLSLIIFFTIMDVIGTIELCYHFGTLKRLMTSTEIIVIITIVVNTIFSCSSIYIID